MSGIHLAAGAQFLGPDQSLTGDLMMCTGREGSSCAAGSCGISEGGSTRGLARLGLHGVTPHGVSSARPLPSQDGQEWAQARPRAAPVGAATPRQWRLEVWGLFLCPEAHFLTRVVTRGSGGATEGPAAGPRASLGVSWHLLCICSGLSMENHVSFRDTVEGFDVISAVNAAFRII